MKSIILCEGQDDLWFISYFLHKTDGWIMDNNKSLWKNYKIPQNKASRKVAYMKKDNNGVAIWSVGGKDSFAEPLHINDDENEILAGIAESIKDDLSLKNKIPTTCDIECSNGEIAHTQITPVIFPFYEAGAIETLLMNAVKEQNEGGSIIYEEAQKYVSFLENNDEITVYSEEYGFTRTNLPGEDEHSSLKRVFYLKSVSDLYKSMNFFALMLSFFSPGISRMASSPC